MKATPLVSVIMPSYDHEKYVGDAIDSILNQTYSNFEFIIIDDHSLDNSFEIISEKTAMDNRIKVIQNPKNLGIANTMNIGIEAAKGEFVLGISSDDVWEPDAIETLVKAALSCGNSCTIVWSDALVIDENGKIVSNSFLQRFGMSNRKNSGNLFHSLLKGNYIIGQTRLVPSKILKEVKYEPSLVYLNDYYTNLCLSSQCDYNFIAERKLARYRIHGLNSILRDSVIWLLDDFNTKKLILTNFLDQLTLKEKIDLNLRMWVLFLLITRKKKLFEFREFLSCVKITLGTYCREFRAKEPGLFKMN
jgi:glycosyltransferase involved in cell wall biosynthesis